MTYSPSKEQFEMELFRWKTDHNGKESQYMTQKGGIVTVRNVYAARLGHSGQWPYWQEGAKQIVVALVAKGVLYKAIQYQLTKIIGHAPGDNAIRGWVTQYSQMYKKRSGVHAIF